MRKDPAAVSRQMTVSEAGRLGGKVGGLSRSPKKVAAARRNAKKGGWPKGKPRTKKPLAL